MIPTTLGALIQSEPALKRLSELRFPVKTAVALKRLINAIAPESKIYYEQRDALLTALGDPAEDGRSVLIRPENRDEFIAKINELLNEPVEINAQPLTATMLGEAELSVVEMDMLGPFLNTDA